MDTALLDEIQQLGEESRYRCAMRRYVAGVPMGDLYEWWIERGRAMAQARGWMVL